jgi:uncharacterized protein YjiS (DUF1127 family)
MQRIENRSRDPDAIMTGSLLSCWTRATAVLGIWRRRHRERRELRELARFDYRTPRELGFTRHGLDIETSKPFWHR